MTALNRYQRLESTGLWRPTPDAQRREVIVGFRDTTLILSDPKTEMALSHWSLPAIYRVNPGAVPAMFCPDDPETTPTESLEITDPEMVAALETVRVTLIRRRPRPGRVRGLVVVSVLTALTCAAIFWLPDAMIRHTAQVLPQATRFKIGKMALADLVRLTGSPCASPLGKRAAATLAQRLTSAGVGEIDIVRDGVTAAVGLPGGIVLLNHALVETPPDAETAAGYALAETSRAAVADPMVPLLGYAGIVATLRLLTSGELPATALDGYAEVLLRQSPTEIDTERLLERFAQVNLSSAAYARAIDPTGETTLALIEADPFKGQSPVTILPDRDWISLQGICTD